MNRSSGTTVAGVDGARGAWLVAFLSLDGRARARFELHHDFAAVRRSADLAHAAVVAVDMPIGLATSGPRAADAEARSRLGHRRSTLFPTPAAAVLEAVDHTDAVARSRAAVGAGISIQAWNLVPQIRQVRAVVAPKDCDRFIECHPESSFVAMTGHPLAPKKSAAGVGERLVALAPHVVDLEHVLAGAPPGCGIDDALDALAAAWSARRRAMGVAEVLGDGATDAQGYPQAITL